MGRDAEMYVWFICIEDGLKCINQKTVSIDRSTGRPSVGAGDRRRRTTATGRDDADVDGGREGGTTRAVTVGPSVRRSVGRSVGRSSKRRHRHPSSARRAFEFFCPSRRAVRPSV